MNTIAWIVYIVWFGSEIVLNRMLRSNATDTPKKDKGSLLIIWVTIVVACFTAGFLTGVTSFPIYSTAVWYYVSLAVIVLGVVLRLLAVSALGKFFTVDVTIREGHQLKQNGMYKYIRHPSYAASLLSFAGYGLSLNNWVSFLLVFVAVFAVFSYRIGIEEKVLAAQFGEAYTAYKKRTKRLIPFVY